MKKYIAIGHWAWNKNITSVATVEYTKANFMDTLKGNEFRPYIVLTEKTFNELKKLDCLEMFDKVKKLTSNWRKYGEIVDYIEQCADIMEEQLTNAGC